MKRTFAILAITLSVIYLSTSGCVKGSDPTDPGNTISGIIPNIASFEIAAAATFIKGAATLINIASTSLVDDNYTVNYTLTGSNSYTGTASMHFSGGQGSFNTEILNNGGNTSITINSITSSTGNTTNITSHNTSSFFDSTGLLTCTINGNPFRATDVEASLSGNMLVITGTEWEPALRTVSLRVNNYAHAPINASFNIADASEFNGAAGYTAPSTAVGDAYGNINITSVSPVLQGSFSFTTTDSSKFAGGTFISKAP
ncbi:MAG: hypothetical protein JSS82_20240 [Bacteroidetes bacterium]|nr:hypothetical protein [Bacteroidota bacterium]